MIKNFFIFTGICILILLAKKFLFHFRIFWLKKKIINNPFCGIVQPDGSYCYKNKGLTLNYRIQDSPAGIKTVEWIFLKRRLSFWEEKTRNLKKTLDYLFLYKKWLRVFSPALIIVFFGLLILLYLGIRQHSLKRAEYFKFVLAQVTGIKPESIRYEGEGWFKFSGHKKSIDKEVEPLTISFNPIKAFFSPDAANVGFWSKKLNTYVSYPVRSDDRGDIWIGKGSDQAHGSVKTNKIVWDKPKKAGLGKMVRGHRISTEGGKLNVADE